MKNCRRLISKILSVPLAAVMTLSAAAGIVPAVQQAGITVSAAESQVSRVKLPEGMYTFTLSTLSGKDKLFFINPSDSSHDYNITVYSYELETNTKSEIRSFDHSYSSYYFANDKLYLFGYDSGNYYDDSDDRYLLLSYDIASDTIESTAAFQPSEELKIYRYSSFGVDSKERFYLPSEDKKTLYLFDKNGTLLSSAASDYEISSFAGFDSTNGNFYFNSLHNWVYWGYDHSMLALRVGNVSDDNTITFSTGFIDLLGQLYYNTYNQQAEMIEGKYLVYDSTFNSLITVADSNNISVNDDFNEDVEWVISGAGDQSFITTHDGSSLRLNRNNNEYYKKSESGYTYFQSSAHGTRLVYMESTNTFLSSYDSHTIYEADPASRMISGTYSTEYSVYRMIPYLDGVILLESDSESNYYIEYIPWRATTKLTISGKTDNMNVGASVQLKAEGNGSATQEIKWKSENPAIASVNASGKVYAWKKGSTNIVAETVSGVKASIRVTVTGSSAAEDPYRCVVRSEGSSSRNASTNDYYSWSKPVKSYIMENSDSTLSRVEYTGSSILIETYSDNGKTLKSTRTLPTELTLFGGFYSGSEYNYFVFGQENPDQNNEQEVIRIVKYSKSWERISELSVKGANTYIPFDAGSLRMDEAKGRLFVYTCHEMYAQEDDNGIHHQANMIFVVNEEDMTLADSYYDIMNISYGYVSHSFNQFIKTDGDMVYRADHGDGGPRSIPLIASAIDGSITDVLYNSMAFPLNQTNYYGNYTGATLGGLEIADDNAVFVGKSFNIDAESPNINSKQNVFVCIVSKTTFKSRHLWLTNYSDDSGVKVFTPQLVKVNNCGFVVMWEEKDSSDKITTSLVMIDSEGNRITDTIKAPVRLSDCQPVLFSDGLIRWYSTDNASPVFYTVNPFDIEQLIRPIEVTSVKLSRKTLTLEKGKSASLKVTILPDDADDKTITWTSSNTSVATVSDGKVTATGKGEAVITAASANGKKASCKVTVRLPLKNESSLSAEWIIAGESINVSCDSSGGKGNAVYAVYYKKTSQTRWAKVSSYSSDKDFTVTPKGTGNYLVRVKAKDESGKIVNKDIGFTVYAVLKNTSVISSSTTAVGRSISITASSRNGVGTKLYGLWVKSPADGKWYKIQYYSENTALSFTPKKTGTYTVRVKAKDDSGRISNKDFKLVVNPSLKNTSSISASTIDAGKSFTLSMSSTGGIGEKQYGAWIKNNAVGRWYCIQDYSSLTSVSYTPKSSGNFTVRVKVIDEGGKKINKDFSVKVIAALKNTSSISASSIAYGKSISVTTSSTGGRAPVTYAVFYKKDSQKTWTSVSPYSGSGSVYITPKGTGNYTVRVKAKDSNGRIVNKDIKFTVIK